MHSDGGLNATDVINMIRVSLGTIWAQYNGRLPLEQIVYLDGVRGIMQREELKSLLEMLDKAKEHVDWLYEVCHDMRVLVIDDNLELLAIVEKFLNKNNIEVDVAASGVAGLELLSASPDKYTLVLLDIQMQDMDGFNVLRHIRENENAKISTMPVIAMSGKADAPDCVDFNYYLRKPFDFEDFIPSIYKVVDENMNGTMEEL